MNMADFDKLDTAFRRLASQGYITRHNHYCCGGCASAAIANVYDEMSPAAKKGLKGAVYYHEQDAEFALNRSRLTLRYTALPWDLSYEARSEATRAVGEEVAEALREGGLPVEWNGDPSTVIEIPNFQATLNDIPRGEGNTLHDADEDDEDEW